MLQMLIQNVQVVVAIGVISLVFAAVSLERKNYTVFSLSLFSAFVMLVLWFVGKL